MNGRTTRWAGCLLGVICLAFTQRLAAQPGVEWIKVIGTERSDLYGGIVAKRDGGVLVAGHIPSQAIQWMGQPVVASTHFVSSYGADGSLGWTRLTPPSATSTKPQEDAVVELAGGDVVMVAQRADFTYVYRYDKDGTRKPGLDYVSTSSGEPGPLRLVSWSGGYYICFSGYNGISPAGVLGSWKSDTTDVYVAAFDSAHGHLWTLAGSSRGTDHIADAQAGEDGRLLLSISSPQNETFAMLDVKKLAVPSPPGGVSAQSLAATTWGKIKPGGPKPGRGSILALIEPDGSVAWLASPLGAESNPLRYDAVALDNGTIRVIGAGDATGIGPSGTLTNINRVFAANVRLTDGSLVSWQPLSSQPVQSSGGLDWFKCRSLISLGSGGFMLAGQLNGTSGTLPNFSPLGAADGLIWRLDAGLKTDMGMQIGEASGGEAVLDLRRHPAGHYFGLATVRASTVRLGNKTAAGVGENDLVLFKLADDKPLPFFLEQPVAAAAHLGGSASFSVEVAAPGALLQWRFNGQPIANATNATLEIPAVGRGHLGSYSVEAINQHGSVWSGSATLRLPSEMAVAVTTLAGDGTPGLLDSPLGPQARFNRPNGPVVRPNGTIFVADSRNHVIRAISPSGAVGTHAGAAGGGYADGPGSSALFSNPIALQLTPQGDLLVADGGNNRLRAIDIYDLRMVSTVAGSRGEGLANGPALEAEFNFPNDLALTSGGDLLVTEFNNHTVRALSRLGQVRTRAGAGMGYRDGPAAQAQFNQPAGIALDAQGNAYVTEWGNHTIRKITPGGEVSLVAGSPGVSGFRDGPALGALLTAPDAIAVDGAGNLYFTEAGNHAVRMVRLNGEVLTLAGDGQPGFADGDGGAAKLNQPGGLALHPDGSLIIADTGNHRVRQLRFKQGTTSPPPLFGVTHHPAVTLFGEIGKSYRIETAESLDAGARWTPVGILKAEAVVERWIDPLPTQRGQRFYRVVVLE